VHQLGPVADERGPDPPAGQPEPEARVAGQRDRGHPHHGERVGGFFVSLGPRRSGGDDERLVAVCAEEFGNTQDAVRDTVDVGGKDSVMIATLMVTPCDINRSRHHSRRDVQANLP
jgi:hypothetical protein